MAPFSFDESNPRRYSSALFGGVAYKRRPSPCVYINIVVHSFAHGINVNVFTGKTQGSGFPYLAGGLLLPCS